MLSLLLAVTLGQTDPQLAKAEKLYDKARYRDALKALGPDCSERSDAAACEKLRAFIHTALGEEREARAAFERLAAAAPDLTLGDEVSPKLQLLYEEARRVVTLIQELEVEPPAGGAREATLLEVRVPEDLSLAGLVLHVESDDESDFAAHELEQEAGMWSARVATDGDELRYYLVAKLPSGASVTVGSARQPKTVRLDVEPRSSRSRRRAGGERSDETATPADPLDVPRVDSSTDTGPFGFPKLAFWGAVGGGALLVGVGITLAVIFAGDDEPGTINVRVAFDE